MSVISKNIASFIGLRFLGLCTIVVLAFILLVLVDIIWKGAGTLSWDFIFSVPRKGMTEGGIYPALVGTTMVTVITAIFSIPVGVATAVYLNEYASDNMFTKILRASIRNLAGVPSIIYGLFGVALFVEALRLGNSVVSSGLTLGLMTLPYIITATEEALRSVPHSHREGALALGATKWEAIKTIILPSAIAGITTGAILGVSRAAGETAPILFTGVTFYLRFPPDTLDSEFMALPYHLYILSTQHHAIEQVRPLAYGTALVLILLIVVLNIIAFIIRNKYAKELVK
ncbi:phosphate ABC transporter permease PstA [Paenimyroides ceti]